MKFSPETLMAYADGELDADARRAVESAMATDADVAAQVERHRTLKAKLHATFDAVLEEQIPARLLEAAGAADASSPAVHRGPGEGTGAGSGQGTGKVADLAAARAAKTEGARKRKWSWQEWTSIAASLLIGVFAGRSVWQTGDTSSGSSLLATTNGDLVATGALATALSDQAGGTSGPSVDIGLSFRAKSGEYCRTFSSHAGGTLAGIACHGEDEWSVRALTQDVARATSGDYRTAGTDLPPLIRQAVEDTIEGEALDAEQEAEARDSGWE